MTKAERENKLPTASLERLSLDDSCELVDFFRNQFRVVDEWCDLNEVKFRLEKHPEVETDLVGLVSRNNDGIIGGVVAYRNPFSHDQWTIPINCQKEEDRRSFWKHVVLV